MKFANVVPAISMDNQRMQTTRFHFHKDKSENVLYCIVTQFWNLAIQHCIVQS